MRRDERRQAGDSEAGYTLIELLIVIVILPLILGAVAAAIITAYQNSGATTNRLNGSVNAQLSSAYFVRDTQGATLITTDGAAGAPGFNAPFSSTNPQICGSSGGSLPGATLLLGIYRGGTNPTSVTYSVTTTGTRQVVRQYCTVDSTAFSTSTPISKVVISDDVPSGTSQGPAIISPSTFNTLALSGWTPTSNNVHTFYTGSGASLPLNGATLSVTPAPTGFIANQPAQIASSAGTQSLTCTDSTSTTLTGCSTPTGVVGTIPKGAFISQHAAVSGISLFVSQPTSAYNITLLGDPRTAVGAGISCSSAGCGNGPSLLTLGGTGVTVTLTGNAIVNINGSVALDNGTLSCTNNTTFTSSGVIETSTGTNGGSSPNCNPNPPVSAWGQNTVPDPYSGVLPSPFPEPPAAQRFFGACCSTVQTLSPGEYTQQWSFTGSSSQVTLKPGVYVLDCGISMTANGASLNVQSDAAGDGVLLYIPHKATDGFGCAGSDGSVKMTGGSINITPLTAAQASQYFASSADPGGAANLWLWQNIDNTQSAALGGNGSTIIITGTAYLPGASVTLDGTGALTVGRVIAQSVTFTGTGTTSITGP